MNNESSFLTLIFTKISWVLFLLLKFKIFIDNLIENRPEGVPKNLNNCNIFGHNYTRLQKVEYLLNRNLDLYDILSFSSWDINWAPKQFSWGSMHKYPHTSCKHACSFLLQVRASYRMCAHFIGSTHVYDYCAPNCARIFMKIILVVNSYLMN